MDGMTKCSFCGPLTEEVVMEGRLWYAMWNRYPVIPGHLLLTPFRHVVGLFNATSEEMTDLPQLLNEAKVFSGV